MRWYGCKNFSQIYALLGMILLFVGESEEILHHRRIAKGNKCPFNLVDIGFSLGHTYRNADSIYEDPFESMDTSLNEINIIPPPTYSPIDCQNNSQDAKCNSSYPYRNHDGTCNNLKYPTWGMAEECQLRFLPAVYDGEDGFRKSVNGQALPEPRDLSLNMLPDVDHSDQQLSHMYMFLGQFVAHDFSLVPTPTRNLDNCCPYNERNRARPECAPIFIRTDDPFYSKFNATCLNYQKANLCAKCTAGGIQKLNRVTSALDLQQVYGKNDQEADTLRLKDGTGRLKFEIKNNVEILPRNIGMFSNFCPWHQSSKCFLTGDDRVDMHATLTSLHTLFLREHNRLATKLKDLNPHWQEETLYQEARKIFGGQWQNIVYREYLPLALGPRHMTHFGLWVGKDDSRTQYNSSARIGVWLEVSTAGFRQHSMVATRMGVRDLRFYETFSNPGLIREGCAETLLEGACRVPSQEFDRFFVEDVSEYFLKEASDPYGLDIGSIDVQRGRGNGMPPYTKMVEYLTGGQTKVTSFDDLKVLMPQKHIELLKNNYVSVHDVDLWLGLQLENHPSRSALSFNAATLSALQFHYLKYADRFYFEHMVDNATSFTNAQLVSVRRSSFSRLLCENANVKSIQKHALLLPGQKNPIVDCDKIAELDLTPWKQK